MLAMNRLRKKKLDWWIEIPRRRPTPLILCWPPLAATSNAFEILFARDSSRPL